MDQIQIRNYEPSLKEEWDACVRDARNGHFMFRRDYMEYHSDRFEDRSLVAMRGDKILGVFPANVRDGVLYSHQGLSFGGWVMANASKTVDGVAMLEGTRAYCREAGIGKLIYKVVPVIYHVSPAQDDVYALFQMGAVLKRVDASSAIDLRSGIKVSSRRRRGIKKAEKAGLEVKETDDVVGFFELLKEVLSERHGATAVHTAEEMVRLMGLFPDEIKIHGAFLNGEMVAGVLVFETETTVHTQYICSSAQGRSTGALDLVFHSLMTRYGEDKRYLSFGISTEDEGRVLNEGLIGHKEEFGARGVAHCFFELEIAE